MFRGFKEVKSMMATCKLVALLVFENTHPGNDP